MKGMKSREFNGSMIWEGLSDEEREEKIKMLKKVSPLTPKVKSGNIISPQGIINSQNHKQEDEKPLKVDIENNSGGII